MRVWKAQRSFTSHRPTHTCFTPVVCALLLSLTPLAGQPPSAQVHVAPSHIPAEHYEGPVGNQGPVLSSSEIAQGAILLHFTHAEGGLCLNGSGRGTFEIAGDDQIWFPADAHLVNGVVVVSTSLVQHPTAVRYAWSISAPAALFNGAGLPAAPFRTDE